MIRTALLVAALVSLPAAASAQSKTAMETLLGKTGATLVKKRVPLETIEAAEGSGTATLTALMVSNPRDPATKGRAIGVDLYDGTDRPGTGYIDLDEIDGLVTGLDWMIKTMGEWEGKEDAEPADVTYSTKGGVTVGFAFGEEGTRPFLRIDRTRVAIDAEGLATFRGTLLLGRDQLKSAK